MDFESTPRVKGATNEISYTRKQYVIVKPYHTKRSKILVDNKII